MRTGTLSLAALLAGALLAGLLAAATPGGNGWAAGDGGAGGPGGDVPRERRRRELAELYFALDPYDPEDLARGAEWLAELARVPPLSERDVERWRERLADLAAERRELPKRAGEHFWWEDEQRGRYFVGGDTRRPEALVVGLHGGGVGSGDASASHAHYAPAADELGWVSICPEVLEKTERGWTDSGTEEWVWRLVDAALRTWDLDPDRVYVTGHSMGGYGTWAYGGHHPDRVAGLAPSAGAPTPVYGRGGSILGIEPGVAPNLLNVRMTVFQSVDDPLVPPDANQAAVREVERARTRYGLGAGYPCEYWEVDGLGHGMPPGGALALLRKVEDARRVARPERVVWQPSLAWKTRLYWLEWTEPPPRHVLVAELDREANAVRIEAPLAPRGLFVLWDEALFDPERELVVELNGAVVWRGRPEPSLATLVRTSLLGDPALAYLARVPVVAPE